MPQRIALDGQDRQLAKQMWEALDFKTTLKECEDAVQIVKECRHYGIDPASILGPGMKTFIRLEQSSCASENREDAI
jgi:hypothetical protein